MLRISAVRAGGVMCLAGVGSFAASAVVWTLSGDQGRPNCPVEVDPVMLGTFGASACVAGLDATPAPRVESQ